MVPTSSEDSSGMVPIKSKERHCLVSLRTRSSREVA